MSSTPSPDPRAGSDAAGVSPARWSPPPSLEVAAGWAWRSLVIAAAVGGVLVLMSVFSVVVTPLALGLFVAAALSPLQAALVARGLRPAAASALCLLVFVVALGLVLWLVVVSLIEPWDSISQQIRHGADLLQQEVAEHAGTQGSDSVDTVRASGGEARSVLLGGVFSVLSLAASLVSTALLTLFVLFFYLKDGSRLWAAVVNIGGARAGTVDRVGMAMWDKVRGFVRGTAIVSLLDATGIGLGAWALGVPSPGAIFALTFVLAFIPYFGAFIAGLVACLLAVSSGGIPLGVAMLAVVLVVQQLEGNLLQPVLVGGAVEIHPMVVALGVIAGGAIGGVLGMFVAIPVIAAATAAVRELQKPDPEVEVEVEGAEVPLAPSG